MSVKQDLMFLLGPCHPDSSLDARPKLLRAFATLFERADRDLPMFFSVSIHIQTRGEMGVTFFPNDSLPEGKPIIFFPLNLDRGRQDTIDYIVAHEIAHVLTKDAADRAMECECGKREDCDCDDCECVGCKNYDNSDCDYLLDPNEQLADALVEKWGYSVPAARARARERALRKAGLPKLTLNDCAAPTPVAAKAQETTSVTDSGASSTFASST